MDHKRLVLLLLFGLGATAALAQTEFSLDPGPEAGDARPRQPLGNHLRLQAGLGLSIQGRITTADDEDPYGGGLYLEGDHVWGVRRGFKPMVYGGLVVTAPVDGSCTHPDKSCNVSTTAVFAGGKVQLTIPIPYVGPFLEIGLGASVGRISTYVGRPDDRQDSGVMLHIPFAVGLALGKQHQYRLAFSYLVYPGRNHVDGSLALGCDVPLP